MSRKLFYSVCVTLLVAQAVLAGGVWEGYVENSPDAVEDQMARGMYSTSSDLEIPADGGGQQHVGLRFSSVMVPKGATIDSAYLEFTVDEVHTGTVNVIIDGELNAAPAEFGTSGFDVFNRTRTESKAKWTIEDSKQVGSKHQSADISGVIEEIVNLPGWFDGGDLVLIVYDDDDNPSAGRRTMETGRGDENSPKLVIVWSLGNASVPTPGDLQTDVSRDTNLAWNPGVFARPANGQTLFFSDSFDAANDGIDGITLSDSSYDLPRLAYNSTYFWRVRQHNTSEADNPINEGAVWSFTTEKLAYPIDNANIAATASSVSSVEFSAENTVNGSGLVDDLHGTSTSDMWISAELPATIEYAFDKAYKLHEMVIWNSNQQIETFIGFGAKDVVIETSADGQTWQAVEGVGPLAQAPGNAEYAANNMIAMNDVAAQFVRLTVNAVHGFVPQASLSEVRFLYLPVTATQPTPSHGVTEVSPDAVLTWKKGREAASHEILISADEQAVIDGTAPVVAVTESAYAGPAYDLNTQYFWMVREVNEVEMPAVWDGDVWSFTTDERIVVDNFESYTDAAGQEVFSAWIDGFDVAGNGSLVGYDTSSDGTFGETTIVHGGKQCMPFSYSNSNGAATSKATYTFDTAQDWSRAGVTTLLVWFQGAAGNTGQMVAEINGAKVVNNGPASNLALGVWQVWSIDLASVSGLQSVRSLTIGVEGSNAVGDLLIDDIELVNVVPTPVTETNEWRIAEELDDVEEDVDTGGMDTGSSDLEMPYEGTGQSTPQIIGLRWTGVPIPQGATITNAYVRFQVDEDKGGTEPVNLIIHGELSANAEQFGSTSQSVSIKSKTNAQVAWSVPNWTNVGDQGPDQTSPNLASIIQEIVNQPSWGGGSIALIISDDPANPSIGVRCAEGGPGSDSALLHIDFE